MPPNIPEALTTPLFIFCARAVHLVITNPGGYDTDARRAGVQFTRTLSKHYRNRQRYRLKETSRATEKTGKKKENRNRFYTKSTVRLYKLQTMWVGVDCTLKINTERRLYIGTIQGEL